MNTTFMSNLTEFEVATGFVRMAMDDFLSHEISNWTGLLNNYWTIIDNEIADNRSKAYPLVDNPIPTVALVLIYLSIVMVIGPLWMRDRKPFNLKNTLIYYNAFQVVLSGYMFYEHLMSGWLFKYNLKCQSIDYSEDDHARRMLNLCYVYYLSKLSEFADTIFFVLRKKKTQITWLHLYHHSLTPIEAFILVRFLAGGNATFPNILNNFVHVCMYFYYVVSAMGPQYQKYLWWKKYMTELQIAQFVLCIVHTIRAMLAKDCSFPKFISALLLLNASIFFVLFMNFYIQNYKKRRVQEQSIADKAAKANAGGQVAPVAIEAKKVQ